MSSTSRHHETSERRKATLHCWECTHSSPIDGDWDHEYGDGSIAYVCPICETTIADRPHHDRDSESEPRPTTAWSRVVRTSISAWRASVGAGAAAATASACERRADR